MALDQELQYQLTAGAIGFVADTYASDPAASRQLLQRLLEPDPLRLHAHEDMSWLARKVKPISECDPAFVVVYTKQSLALRLRTKYRRL